MSDRNESLCPPILFTQRSRSLSPLPRTKRCRSISPFFPKTLFLGNMSRPDRSVSIGEMVELATVKEENVTKSDTKLHHSKQLEDVSKISRKLSNNWRKSFNSKKHKEGSRTPPPYLDAAARPKTHNNTIHRKTSAFAILSRNNSNKKLRQLDVVSSTDSNNVPNLQDFQREKLSHPKIHENGLEGGEDMNGDMNDVMDNDSTDVLCNKTQSRLSLASSSSKYCPSSPTTIVNGREASKDESSSPKGDSDINHSRSSSPKGSQKGSDRKSLNPSVSGIQRAASAIKTFISPNYKSRNDEYRKLFKTIPESEKFVIDYSCAFQREILVHGRMYVSQQSICFYANIFGWETNLVINFQDIGTITKERTAKVIPNAIQLVTQNGEKFFFTSFGSRDKSFMLIFKLWQSALLGQMVSPQEMWVWAEQGYNETDMSDNSEDLVSESDGGPLKNVSSWMGLLGEKENRSPESHINEIPIFIAGCPSPEIDSIEEDISIRRRRRGRSPPKLVTTSPSNPQFVTDLVIDDGSETDAELSCPCKDHPGQCLINQVYPVSVDQLFNFLFTNSEFNRNFSEMRKTTELVVSDWAEDSRTNQKRREMTYTVSLNHSMGPKSCSVSEKQTVSHYGNSGQVYVIKSEAQNQGIPYADNFSVQSVFCLSRVSANEGRVQCHANVAFKKNVWGIVKSFIEKNTLAGMQEHFNDLDTELKKECDKLGLPVSPFPNTTPVNANIPRRENRMVNLERNHETQAATVFSKDYSGRIDFSVKALIVLLLVMLVLNAFLLYKLWSVDNYNNSTHNIYGYTLSELKDILKRLDTPENDIKRIMEVHEENARSKWMEAIQSALYKLGRLETEIGELKNQISVAENDYSTFFKKEEI